MIVTHEWAGERNASESIKKVNGVEVSRNLIASPEEPIDTTEYLVHLTDFYLTPPKDGELLTLSLKGNLGSDRSYFSIYNSGGAVNVQHLYLYPHTLGLDGVYRRTGRWYVGNSSNSHIRIYAFPRSGLEPSIIEWIMLERGQPSQTFYDGDTPDYSTNNLKVYSENEWKDYTPKLYI